LKIPEAKSHALHYTWGTKSNDNSLCANDEDPGCGTSPQRAAPAALYALSIAFLLKIFLRSSFEY